MLYFSTEETKAWAGTKANERACVPDKADN